MSRLRRVVERIDGRCIPEHFWLRKFFRNFPEVRRVPTKAKTEIEEIKAAVETER